MSLAPENCFHYEQNLNQRQLTRKTKHKQQPAQQNQQQHRRQRQMMAGPPEEDTDQQCSNKEIMMKAPRRRTFNEISTLRRPLNSSMVIGGGRPLAGRSKSHQIKKMAATNYLTLCHLASSLGALCLILSVAIVTAESFSSNSNSAQQQQEGSSAATVGDVAAGHHQQQQQQTGDAGSQADFAVAASNNYQLQQQDHHHQAAGQSAGQKSKKIQIVYIKVPLAKLRPSLASQDSYLSGNGAGNSSASSSAAVPVSATKTNEQYETTDSKSQQQQLAGSQQQQQLMGFSDEQQQQMNLNDFNDSDGQQRQIDIGGSSSGTSRAGGGFQQAQSFLIPMAVVQTSQSSNEFGQPNGDAFNYELLGRQQQPIMAGSYESANNAANSAGSQLHPQHAQPSFSMTSSQYQASELSSIQSGGSNRVRSPSMNLHEHNRQQQLASSSAPISHGFMSGFLLGEKEKMTAAAMRLQKQRQLASSAAASTINGNSQQQQVAAAASQVAKQQVSAPSNNDQLSSYTPQPLSSTSSSPSTSSMTTSSSPSSISSLSLNPKGPGGLMPSMIAPLSRMPDNAIGQAYGAAVGIALPTESGSPSSLMSSSSVATNYGKQQLRAAGSNLSTNISNSSSYGINGGTPGGGAYSSGTGSSTSYGANGPSQQGAGSSGKSYQPSSQSFAATGHSSSYGNGISTSGASGAFFDYPAGQSSSNNYNHQPQSQQHNSLDYNGRLKQAKKTIIPIVVQVEHAILENNNNAMANAYHQSSMKPQGSKYGGGRSNRQLDSKRGSRYNSKQQQLQGNQLYGMATNEIAQYGDIPPGAQWINAANAYDINQITAQINAENAASAAAALAQADATFGPSAPAAYSPPNHSGPRYPVQRPAGQVSASTGQAGQSGSAYAANLQSAASALLANTHPMIQAAASGGLASVSKLGAKLGEMMALPSMPMPSSIASISSSLPSAFSSITNQMGAQFGQAVQQVAKEHPHASAFARQVAQQAGIQLPNFGGPQQIVAGSQSSQAGSPMAAAASNQQHTSQLSPQAQLQNLKLSIGQNLQTAAATLIGVNQKANGLGSGNQLLGNANHQMVLSAALKQLSSISPAAAQFANQLAGSVQAAASNQQQTAVAPPSDGPLSNIQQSQMNAFNQFMQQQQQVHNQLANFQQANQPGAADPLDSAAGSLETSASSTKPVKSSSFKSKFLSFFQPPKFISNFLSWNERADARNDKGEFGEIQLDLAAFVDKLEEASNKINSTSTKTNNTTTSMAPSTSVTSSSKNNNTTTTTEGATGKSGQQTNSGTILTAQKATSVASTSVSASANQKGTTPKVQVEALSGANATATTAVSAATGSSSATTTPPKRDKN